MELRIDSEKSGAVSAEDLRGRLARIAVERHSDIALIAGGKAVSLLKSGDRAMLVFFRATGDPGLTSRAGDGPHDHSLRFRLANGQVDEYPASWTVTFEEGLRVLEHFATHLAPAPFVRWNDEAG